MRAIARALGLLGGVLLALPGGTEAAVYGARVRWQASSDTAVAGYRVWVRPADGSYDAPREAGLPVGGDGTYAFVVDGLDPRTDYAVSVSAYGGDGTESPRSNELQIGYAQVAPLIDSDGDGLRDAAEDPNLNRVVDAGETDPTRADTDRDGVGDATDRCGGTVADAAVNAQGCACAQITCGDGNACNGTETCQAGVCHPGTSPACDDGTPCTTDGCRAASGCTHTPVPACSGCTTDAQCDDGNACNGGETCRGGTCTAGTSLDCDDGDRCTTDACTPETGCTHAPEADCGACPQAIALPPAGGSFTGATSGTSRFTAGCEPTTGNAADTVFAWTPARSGTAIISTCGPETKFDTVLALRRGTCDGDAELGCNDDSEGCAIDSGERLAGRQGSTITTRVTAGETYYIVLDGYDGRSGAFTLSVSAPVACTAADCDDDNPCTTDSCDPERGCSHEVAPDQTPCDDGLFCTVGETCRGGTCGHGGPNCTGATDSCQTGNCDEAGDRCFTTPRADGTSCGDGTLCNGAESCRDGRCTPSLPLDCDDHDPCTLDTCEPGTGCGHTPMPDGSSCDDGSFCNGAEACRAGACVPASAPDCDDGNACTRDACNEDENRCGHESVENCCAANADCADEDACTADERCREGRCVSDPVRCPDAGACGESTCDPQRGCAEAPRAEGSECEDGDPCTRGERCAVGVCAPPVTQVSAGSPGGELEVTRFLLRPLGRRGQLLIAEARFTSPWTSDPSETGVTTQLMAPDGEVLYSATLPASALRANRRRTSLVYTAADAAPEAIGLRRLVLRTGDRGARVTLRAVVPRKIGATPAVRSGETGAAGRGRFAWAVWVGNVCDRDPAVSCARSDRGKRCR